MSLFDNLSGYWFRIQDSLFPWMEERIGELTNTPLWQFLECSSCVTDLIQQDIQKIIVKIAKLRVFR